MYILKWFVGRQNCQRAVCGEGFAYWLMGSSCKEYYKLYKESRFLLFCAPTFCWLYIKFSHSTAYSFYWTWLSLCLFCCYSLLSLLFYYFLLAKDLLKTVSLYNYNVLLRSICVIILNLLLFFYYPYVSLNCWKYQWVIESFTVYDTL